MINKHLASLALDEDSPFTNSCLFTLDRLSLLLLLRRNYSSSAVQKRHSKVYEQPIAPSLYSILLARNKDLILNLHSWDIKGEGLKWIYKTGRGVK